MLRAELMERMSSKQGKNSFADYPQKQRKDALINSYYHETGTAEEAALFAEKQPIVHIKPYVAGKTIIEDVE